MFRQSSKMSKSIACGTGNSAQLLAKPNLDFGSADALRNTLSLPWPLNIITLPAFTISSRQARELNSASSYRSQELATILCVRFSSRSR